MLYLRSRRVPAALAAAGGCVAAIWALWAVTSAERDADVSVVLLTVLLAVAALTATLAGPDDELEHSGALPRPPRRAVHLLAAAGFVVLLLLATLPTGARFGPAGLVVRDALGLLGLTALGAVTVGAGRAWIAPLAWTLTALTTTLPDAAWAHVLAWPVQPPDNTPAAGAAGVLAVAGLGAYAIAGPRRRES